MLALQSCNNGKTYAEMKEEEADAINKYILENDIKVISEADFAAQDSTTKENEYVLLDEVESICMWIIEELVRLCWEMEPMIW